MSSDEDSSRKVNLEGKHETLSGILPAWWAETKLLTEIWALERGLKSSLVAALLAQEDTDRKKKKNQAWPALSTLSEIRSGRSVHGHVSPLSE
jgi:hypothetical protein